jgi:hypothetical protein
MVTRVRPLISLVVLGLLLALMPEHMAFGADTKGEVTQTGPTSATVTIYTVASQAPTVVPLPKRLQSRSGGGWSCRYHELEAPSGSSLELPRPKPDPAATLVPGQRYAFVCHREDGTRVTWPTPTDPALALTSATDYRLYEYDPGNPAAPLNAFPEFGLVALAEQARANLQIPQIVVKTSPEGEQLIGMPTWFYLAQYEAAPEAYSEGNVGGVRAKATATLRTDALPMEIDPGDGRPPFLCPPGVPWSEQADRSTACTVTYQHLVRPGTTAKVKVHYYATWTATDGSIGGDIGPLESPVFEVPIQTKGTQAVGR